MLKELLARHIILMVRASRGQGNKAHITAYPARLFVNASILMGALCCLRATAP